jgi:hypothetical protein
MKNLTVQVSQSSNKSLLVTFTLILMGAFALIMIMTGGDAELIAKAIR